MSDTNTMDMLHALLREREQYEGWIRALDTRRGSTPAHVYDRVHADYQQRLRGVLERLTSQAEQLHSALDTLSARLHDLRAREAERLDARHEGELRAAVGEYSEAEWGRLSAEADREIGTIAEERRAVEAEVAELRGIVELSSASTVVPPDPERQADGSPVADVPDSTTLHQAVEPAVEVEAEAEVTASASPVWPEPEDAEPTLTHPPEQPVAVPESPLDRPAPAAATAAPGQPAITIDSRGEQGKTLHCPECGAANYATEWYCERCGGELATL